MFLRNFGSRLSTRGLTRLILTSSLCFSLCVPASAGVADLDFAISLLPLPDAGAYRETVIGDVDGDGRNELVVSTAAGHLYVCAVDEGGTLVLLDTITLPTGRPGPSQWISPQIDDIDGDGDMDLAAWWRRNNTRGVLDVAYRGTGGFQVVSYPTPDTDAGYRMAFGDFDGDGLSDVLTVNHGYSAPVRLFVSYNSADPASRFVLTGYDEFSFPGAAQSTGVFVTDLDSDGLLDAAVTTHHAGPEGLRLLYGDLQTLFLYPGDGTKSSSVAFGDADSDGLTDIVTNATVPHSGRNYLRVYQQLPGRAFAPPIKLFASGDRPKMPMFADLDGDGVDELVVSVTSNRTLDLFGRDLFGRITGPPRTLNDPILASVDHGYGTNPNVLTVGDVDNDGDLDLLVGGTGTVLLQNITNRPPVAVCASPTVAADGSCLAEANVDGGSYDPDGEELTRGFNPPPPYGLGETAVELAVSDGYSESSCSGVVTVVDETSPVVVAPEPLALECSGTGGVLAADPAVQEWIASAFATDNCSGPPLEISNDVPTTFPSACPPGLPTEVTFTAVDEAGNQGSSSSSVTVGDTTPPTVSCSVALNSLAPPDRALVDIGLSVVATDTCDSSPATVEVTVTSDEPTAEALRGRSPQHCPDAVVGPGRTVLLRAERSGNGDGRVYVITVTATDSCGNVGVCQAQVGVPKSHGSAGEPVNSGQTFDATSCN